MSLEVSAEEAQLNQDKLRLCEAVTNAATINEITNLLTEANDDVKDIKFLDDYLYAKKPPRTLILLTVEKASKEWPRNKEQVVNLLKSQIIDKRADFVRALAIESKTESPPELLKILLEIIFPETLVISDVTYQLNVRELAAKAAEDQNFLRAVDDLRKLYSQEIARNGPQVPNHEFKNLETKRKDLQLYEIQANPHVRSLKWYLETSSLFRSQGTLQAELLTGKNVKVGQLGTGEYEVIPSVEELNIEGNDIFLGTLQFVSDIRDEIPCNSYFKTEYQNLSEQAEEFAVALIDEVKDEKELSTVIKMEDKLTRETNNGFEENLTWMRQGIEKVSLIQHAINLRCKSFVVSKNCQHLVEKIIFGRSRYRAWNGPSFKTGSGMLLFIILVVKLLVSILCGAVMVLLLLPYLVLSLLKCCDYQYCTCLAVDRFFELYERPCQKFLFELWWFLVFLGLVIHTSVEEDFDQKNLPSGLTVPDILVFIFVLMFALRLFTSIFLRLRVLCTIPRYRWNWHLIIPDVLPIVEFASLLFFTLALTWWTMRWQELGGWQKSDEGFGVADLCYSIGSLLCFFKLAHFLKAQHTLGTINLSLYKMFTKNVIYFAIPFTILLYVPFATGLRRMYSYYVIDNENNRTQPLANYRVVYDDLLWTMLGIDMKKDIEIEDSDYADVKKLGEAFVAVFTVAAVVVAFNMLIATMNHTYEHIMKNLDKEYVFYRTKMWMEYIAMDHSVLPPPLNLGDFFHLFKCCKYASKSKSSVSKEEARNKWNERISIIKLLVFRYLSRSLKLEDLESQFDNVASDSSTRRDRDPAVLVLSVTS